MINQNNKQSLKRLIIISACIFVITYIVVLVVWLIFPIEDYYGLAITKIASYLLSVVKDLDITEIVRNKDVISVGFMPDLTGLTQGIKTTVDVPTGNYAFNLPLTLAIMAAFFPLLKSKRLYLEVLIILVFVHLLFVFSLEGQKVSHALAVHGYENPGRVTQFFWEFLWGFVNNMVVRFEPFLIGAYLFLMRNRESVKKVKDVQTSQKKTHIKKKTHKKR